MLTSPDSTADSDRLGRNGQAAVLCTSLAIFLAHAASFQGFICDDAFITLRYARNIALGAGPVFNVGDRVEGFSNPLLTFLLAAVQRAVPDPEWPIALARLIGVAASAGTLLVLSRLRDARGTPGLALALALTATTTSVALWAVAGLETSLYGLLIVGAMAMAIARARSKPATLGLGFLLAAIVLSRPEGVLPATALYVARLLDPATRDDVRGHARIALAGVLPVVGYLAFRWTYYGEWLPNTFYAKHRPPVTSIRAGARYLFDFVVLNGGWLLYLPAPLALWHPRGRRSARLAFGVLLAYAPFIFFAGGDYLNHHRFIAPVVPLIALLTGLGWERAVSILTTVCRRRWPATPVHALTSTGLALAWLLLLVPTVRNTMEERHSHYVNAVPYYSTIGRVVGAVVPTNWTVAVHDIGAIGWYGNTRVLDLFGLVDRSIARGEWTPDEAVERLRPEVVILHYDSRQAPVRRWRDLTGESFRRDYRRPRLEGWSIVPFRVRLDVLPLFEDRLAALPVHLRRELGDLDLYLSTHQPDGRPVIGPLQP